MKRSAVLLLLFMEILTFGQTNTEVYLFDLITDDGKFSLSNIKNISNNEGYDNQPSFLDNTTLFFSSSRNKQTDIAKYSIKYDIKTWVCFTDGSEYSPLKIPGENAVSSIRLEKDGTQKLYKYSLKNGDSKVLIDNLVIGYHSWLNKHMLVSSVLEDGQLLLYVTNFITQENHKLDTNIGRSLHKIPNTKLASYISKATEPWEIKSLHPTSGVTTSIMATLPQVEDMCWLSDGTILMGKDDILYTFTPNKDVDWIEVASLKEFGITNITRVTVSPNGTKFAIVGEAVKKEKEEVDSNTSLEPKLENISWISGNWIGEAFGGIAEENWSEPHGNSMMASFKLVKDGKVLFYEIEIIREINNTLLLQLKHFNNDLKGWEEKDDTVDFPLVEITSDKVVFEGMTFEKISDTEMNVYVDIEQKDKEKETIKFNYKKQ